MTRSPPSWSMSCYVDLRQSFVHFGTRLICRKGVGCRVLHLHAPSSLQGMCILVGSTASHLWTRHVPRIAHMAS